ncbi:hypothetical protein Q1695_007033 [Nippostrongylus brasiliensis]|nr:hypothetical protein Q1695_007033 [Nippostrongylus brasiliensis]
MRTLEWDNMIKIKINSRQLYHLRFANDIVLITPSRTHAGRLRSCVWEDRLAAELDEDDVHEEWIRF